MLRGAPLHGAMCGSGGGMNIYSAAQLSALTRLFSATVFREMAKKGRSGLFRRLIDQTDLLERAYPRATVGDTFDSAFDILKVAGHRDESLYRAAHPPQVHMRRHPLRPT